MKGLVVQYLSRAFSISAICASILVMQSSVPVSAASISINETCHAKFPKWHQWFERRDCVKELEAEEEQNKRATQLKKENELRKERARACISKDVWRMEKLASRLKSSLSSDTIFEKAFEVLDSLQNRKPSILISNQSIKDLVIVSSIYTKCDSEFHFLVNINGRRGEKIKSGS